MNEMPNKHYPTYLIMIIGMITSFCLGVFLVEMPFATGIDYFHTVQRNNLIAKQIRMFQNQNAVQKAEVDDSQYQRGVVTCRATYDICAQRSADDLIAQRITEVTWLETQAQCAHALDSCVTNLANLTTD